MIQPGDLTNIQKGEDKDWAYWLSGFPFNWQSKVKELKKAAEILYQNVAMQFEILSKIGKDELKLSTEEWKSYYEKYPSGLSDIVLLLTAYSMENLFKGLIIMEEPDDHIQDGKLKGRIITSHNLILLAECAKISLTKHELEFCELAKDAIHDFGRYPLPKDKKESALVREYKMDIFSVYENLFNRTSDEYKKRFPNRTRPKRSIS